MTPTFLLRFRARTLALLSSLCLLLVPSLHAQGTGLVLPGDLIYTDIERLAELGVLDSTILGQRPYSRREIARIARIVRARLERHESRRMFNEDVETYADGLLAHLERFADDEGTGIFEPRLAIVDGGSLTFSSTDADRRGFPAAHTRPTEATIEPLAERRLGMPAVRGRTTALEAYHRAEPTSWLAVQLGERVELRSPNDTTLQRSTAELLIASVRARYRNAALTIGRQQFAWAQSAGDGLFLASDAPALDQISLAGDHPFVLPSVLRLLGPTQATIILADLGASVARSHSKLLTYKVTVHPSALVELGGTFMDHYGGSGARKASASDQLIDFLPFIDVFRTHNYRDSTRSLDVDSDKILGVDGRLRLPALGGLVLAGELLIDDFDVNRIPKLLTGYGSQTLAIILPRLGSPALSMKLSVKHMGIITYSHGDLRNGTTTRGRLLGDELGTDAKSYSAQLRWNPSASTRFELEGRSAIHSNANYLATYPDPGGTRYVVTKVSRTADELRDLIFASAVIQGDDGIALTMRAGGERIRNASFQGGRRRDYIAQVGLRIGQ